MADLAWPLSLPQTGLLDGTVEQLATTTVRFAPDVGPAQVRRRHTAGVVQIPYRLYLSPAEYDAFVQFFNDTTEGGALPFDWVHPITGSPVTFRFLDAPSIGMLTPSTGASPRYAASFTLEILPATAAPEVIVAGRIFALDLNAQRPPTPEDLELLELERGGYIEASGTNWIEPGAAGSGPDGPGDPDTIGGGGTIPDLGGGGVGCRGCNSANS